MLETDVSRIVELITQFSSVDGGLARRYYHSFFAACEQVNEDDEQNHVACTDEAVVGVTGFCPDKYEWPGIRWLNWLYVDVSYRRRGIGSKLLTFTIDQLRALGCRKVYLDTSTDHNYSAAIALYTKYGFVEEGRFTDYYGLGEHYLVFGLNL